jgi:hypothetical protein
VKSQRYTVLWLGSSRFMCDDLSSQLTPGQGAVVGLLPGGDPMNMYTAPSQKSAVAKTITRDTVARVICQTDDANQDTWVKVQVCGTVGFVYAESIETSNDYRGPPHC